MGQEEKGCSGNGGTAERKSEKDVCVSSTAEAKPSTDLGNGPAHDFSMPLCQCYSIFAQKSPKSQARLHIVGDEVGQRPVSLEDSASVQQSFICCAELFRYQLVQ